MTIRNPLEQSQSPENRILFSIECEERQLKDLSEMGRSALLSHLERLEEEKLATFYALLHSDAIRNLLSADEHRHLQQLLMAWRKDPDSLTAAEKRAACGVLVELALDIAGEETA